MTGTKNALRELVTDPAQVAEILGRSEVLFLAIHSNPAPYVLPVFFGFEQGRLYVHSAPGGAKVELLRADPRVGFTAVCSVAIVEGTAACSFSARAESVTGSGIAGIVEDEAERLHGLDLIVRHYASRVPAEGFTYAPASLSRTRVIRIDIQAITGKRIGG